MIGFGSQIGFSGVAAPVVRGNLTLVGGAPSIQAILAAVNLSTEGTKDWHCYTSDTTLGNWNLDSGAVPATHTKILGSRLIRNKFRILVSNGKSTLISDVANSKWQLTTTPGDDDNIGNELTASLSGTGSSANNVSTGYNFGFRIGVPAYRQTRQVNLYLDYKPCNAGGTSGNGFSVVARLSDGSAPDVTYSLVPVTQGIVAYKFVYTFNSVYDGQSLEISFIANNNVANQSHYVLYRGITVQ